jgi:serine/threonine protein kinase
MLSPGQVLQERYQIQQKLGQNSGRQTWLALDLKDERSQPVVLKMLAFGGDVQWDDLKLFEREAQILKQLNHPRIPKYKDYFAIDDRHLWFGLVQEYIPGKSFKDLLKEKKRFTETEIRTFAENILEILIYLHSLNPPVLHRDIKPSNLIWGEDEQVYLVDFGAVQDRATAEGTTFTVVGTYGYAPMEQFGGRAVPASDLYALGATLIHLMVGIAPADLPSRDLRIQFRQKLDLDNERKIALADWLERLTEPAVEKRLPTARQALESLRSGLPTRESFADLDQINQPNHTEVNINKSWQALEINIPMRGIRTLTDIGLLALTMFSGLFVLRFAFNIVVVAILGAGWFWLFLPFIRYIFSAKKIIFNQDEFKIQSLFFSLIPYIQKGFTQGIRDISISYFSNHPLSQEKSLIINTKLANSFNQRYFCAQGLSEDELIWIAQEIRSWLSWQGTGDKELRSREAEELRRNYSIKNEQ